MERWKDKGGRKIEEVVGRWNCKEEREREKKKKTLKLEMLQRFVLFCLFFFFFCFFSSFKLKRLTQNPKTELKMFWVGLDSGTKYIRGGRD